ncbi:CaiB/BaiF CoA transferase family protein [Paractinoplanes rhizophilus]|jgi:formyl-CoA transferase|uniref:CaiB/BaiF CoA transferase family protein n=1 Tax=Paractinoplanes rhizophilus TaxID=1416877 RepID=A0ABW2HXF3_9ACTN|nr:CoA transferase [Actinoplanes sp.]
MSTKEAGAGLKGLRVVEMGQLLAGPFCGQLLGDFGAEVIKIEPPGEGDPMRNWGRERPYGKSLWWPVVARNKKSVELNLRGQAGQQAVRDLVEKSDVLIENFRPGRLEGWGLSPDALLALNPRLIVIRVTGYGQTGPYAKRAGFGSIGEAMGGLRYIVGQPDGFPSRMGISIGDALAGTMGALGGLVAINARHRTGRGQVVDSAIFEAVLSYMESMIPEYVIGGYIRERTGSVLPNVAPSNVYPTRDGQLVLIAGNQDTVFRRLAAAMQRDDLAKDERFATHAARGKNAELLDEIITEWTASIDSDPLLDLMEDSGVPAGRMYRAPEMLADPHFAARESIISLPHPDFGELPMQNVAPRLSDTPGQVRWVGPELGAHNDEILRGLLGMTDEQVARAQA